MYLDMGNEDMTLQISFKYMKKYKNNKFECVRVEYMLISNVDTRVQVTKLCTMHQLNKTIMGTF